MQLQPTRRNYTQHRPGDGFGIDSLQRKVNVFHLSGCRAHNQIQHTIQQNIRVESSPFILALDGQTSGYSLRMFCKIMHATWKTVQSGQTRDNQLHKVPLVGHEKISSLSVGCYLPSIEDHHRTK